MNLPISYSKYNTFATCPIKYFHQYVLKTRIEEELTYPLVLGQLVHLFIKLYNDGTIAKVNIRNIKDDLNVLYNYIDLKYPAITANSYEVKNMNVRPNVEKTIKFIEENEIVFHHAVKLFNIYHERFFPKINADANFATEVTFYNVHPFEKCNACYYGSIDLLFYKPELDKLKYIYISDFKTGKSLYEYYYEQLFFYFYNLKNYNVDAAKNIINNIDDINLLTNIKENLTNENTHLLLFNLREGIHEKKTFADAKIYEWYEKFINQMNDDVENNITLLHKDKENISFIDIKDSYADRCKYVDIEDVKIKDQLSFTCTYCKFKENCQYRILK